MSRPIIEVKNISKCYQLGAIGATRLRDDLERVWDRWTGKAPRVDESEFWALRDVSFEVQPGEVVGIIGRNGAGKSTLLKILSRITEPTSGEIVMRGRVASLLEVGTGFVGDLSGRDNIFLNGAILGMSRAEIRKKFDEIVAFSEVEKFIDTPVKRYSSGMFVRLAFAVAAHLEPEILIIDEVLAVGDTQFQKKCIGKMQSVSRAGKTVLFVSHNMAAVQNLCRTGIFLNRGEVEAVGSIQAIIARNISDSTIAHEDLLSSNVERSGNGRIRISSCHFEDMHGNRVICGMSGEPLVVALGFVCNGCGVPRRVSAGLSIHGNSGETLSINYSEYSKTIFDGVPPRGEFRFAIDRLPLSGGAYRLGARLLESGEEADWPKSMVATLAVEPGDFFGSGSMGFGKDAPVLIDGSWTMK